MRAIKVALLIMFLLIPVFLWLVFQYFQMFRSVKFLLHKSRNSDSSMPLEPPNFARSFDAGFTQMEKIGKLAEKFSTPEEIIETLHSDSQMRDLLMGLDVESILKIQETPYTDLVVATQSYNVFPPKTKSGLVRNYIGCLSASGLLYAAKNMPEESLKRFVACLIAIPAFLKQIEPEIDLVPLLISWSSVKTVCDNIVKASLLTRFERNSIKPLLDHLEKIEKKLHITRKVLQRMRNFFSSLAMAFEKNTGKNEFFGNHNLSAPMLKIAPAFEKLYDSTYGKHVNIWAKNWRESSQGCADFQKDLDKIMIFFSGEKLIRFVIPNLFSPGTIAANFLFTTTAFNLSKINQVHWELVQKIEGAKTMLLINVFKNEMGRFPKTLDELRSEFGPLIGQDFFSNKSMVYTESPLALYSAGGDEKFATPDDFYIFPEKAP